ncbi:quinoprotein relay system zinc metallohydrolase 2 [Methylicorpusculum oleiharenae]|uniref:quinoprotein relay system zinc metallohydrolase 2 n=1 Tax=Methylicorpusculum oleiharenae TaxID=1338687 RepID=UPI001E40D261|nr:quinoprotein relay system zinc metallohydrolase 2 [Methylicorpusculum oleiharenae]
MRFFLILLCMVIARPLYAQSALTMTEAAKGIYVHQGKHELPDTTNHGAIANIGFIVGDRCVAVIDTGGNPNEGMALKRAIQKVTSKPVCYVINTHVHPDHIYGNIVFKMPGVQFIGHKNLARAMAARAQFYLDRASEQIAVDLKPENLIPPDKAVNGLMKIDLGGRVLELTAHAAAHTDNDLTVYDPATETLWMSDLLFIGHLPVIDGSLLGWVKEIKALEKRSFKIVIPGHGPIVRDWPKSLQPEKQYLETLQQEIRALIKSGKFIEEAIETVGYQFKDQWLLFDQFHRKNVTAAFAELEWEE